MTRVSDALLALHIGLGSIALVVGAVALLSAKGEARHLRAGRAFIRLMVLILASAAILLAIHRFNGFLAGLTVFVSYLTFSGYRVLLRKRPDRSFSDMPRRADWAAALLAVVVGVGLLFAAYRRLLPGSTAVVYSTAIGTIVYATYDLWRFARPLAWPFSPHLWVYEHIVKIMGAYIGVVAAFAGSVLLLFQPPWRQLWPSLVGTPAMILIIIYYHRELSRNPGHLISRLSRAGGATGKIGNKVNREHG